ncbi:MAG: hypothetical protein ACFB20_04145 [Opitutales bacterium]
MSQFDADDLAADAQTEICLTLPENMVRALESQANIRGLNLEQWVAQAIRELAEDGGSN